MANLNLAINSSLPEAAVTLNAAFKCLSKGTYKLKLIKSSKVLDPLHFRLPCLIWILPTSSAMSKKYVSSDKIVLLSFFLAFFLPFFLSFFLNLFPKISISNSQPVNQLVMIH